MANCEEIECFNVQSAICLHCHHHLCITHIVAHGTLLLKEGDKLGEEINELIEQLNICLQKIHLAREETTYKLNIWRQNQIDKVEDKYAEKVQDIEFRKDHLTDLENQLTQRLIKEAKQPLEYMQTQQNACHQSLQAIRQAIANIAQDSLQLDLCLKDSSNQSSSSSIVNTTVTDNNYLLQSNLSSRCFINSSINSSDLQSLITTPFSLNQNSSTVASNTFSNQRIVTPSWRSKPTNRLRSAASDRSVTNIKRPPTNPCKNLIKFFQNISGSSNHSIEHFIVQNLNRVVHVNNLMVLLLSLLEAWHSPKSPTVFNQDVLSYHINIVKKYIKESEQQLTVIAAIQVFVNSCNYDEKNSHEMMTILLQFFFDHQCIPKETILNWYKNGAKYGYTGFGNAKIWAESFINQINIHIESK